MKVCVLALLIERVAEHRYGQPWSRIKCRLDELQISNFSTDAYRLFTRNEITSNAHRTLTSRGIKPPPIIERLETIAETAENL